MRATARNGMRFEYSYQGHDNSAYFAYGAISVTYTVPPSEWKRVTEQERHKWRQAKYAQALRHFNLHRS